MLVPLILQLWEELVVVGSLNLLRDALQMTSDDVSQAIVQLVAKLVQHHVVRVAVQLLKAQAACILLVDLTDRVVECLPGPVRVVCVHLLVMLEGLNDELAPLRRHGTLTTKRCLALGLPQLTKQAGDLGKKAKSSPSFASSQVLAVNTFFFICGLP